MSSMKFGFLHLVAFNDITQKGLYRWVAFLSPFNFELGWGNQIPRGATLKIASPSEQTRIELVRQDVYGMWPK